MKRYTVKTESNSGDFVEIDIKVSQEHTAHAFGDALAQLLNDQGTDIWFFDAISGLEEHED